MIENIRSPPHIAAPMQALASTAIVFFGLSGYVLTTRKDFSFMGGFLMVGMLGLLAVIVIGLFVNLSAFQMAISAGVVQSQVLPVLVKESKWYKNLILYNLS